MYKLLFKVKIGLLLLLSENKEKFLDMLACTIYHLHDINISNRKCSCFTLHRNESRIA